MARIKSRDTKPELTVRRLLHHMGYRYRLHRKDLPGRPDIVFAKRRKVIFVHGCFWHRHNDPDCRFARLPKSRVDFWEPKLFRNAERDSKQLDSLGQLGWETLIVWECQVRQSEYLEKMLKDFLER